MDISDIVVHFHDVGRKTVLSHRVIFQFRQHGRALGQRLFEGETELQGGALLSGVNLQEKDIAVIVDQIIAAKNAAVPSPTQHFAHLDGVVTELSALRAVDGGREFGADETVAVDNHLIRHPGNIDVLFVGDYRQYRGVELVRDEAGDEIDVVGITEFLLHLVLVEGNGRVDASRRISPADEDAVGPALPEIGGDSEQTFPVLADFMLGQGHESLQCLVLGDFVVELAGQIFVRTQDRHPLDLVQGHFQDTLVQIDIQLVLALQDFVDQGADDLGVGNRTHEFGGIDSPAAARFLAVHHEAVIGDQLFIAERVDDDNVGVVVLDTNIGDDRDEADLAVGDAVGQGFLDKVVEAVGLQFTYIEKVVIVGVVGEVGK